MYIEENEKIEKEFGERLAEYFGESALSIDVCASGRIVNVCVRYEDFKPVREVRKDIEGMGDCVNVQSIIRDYSVERVSATKTKERNNLISISNSVLEKFMQR